jgi:hypothetical protein
LPEHARASTAESEAVQRAGKATTARYHSRSDVAQNGRGNGMFQADL